MPDRRPLRYEAELGGPGVQPAPRWFAQVDQARWWAIGQRRASDWCLVRYGGAVVAEYRRAALADGLRWYRVVTRQATGGRRKFFVYGPAVDRLGLRLLRALVVRGESEEAVRRRLVESEGYPPTIVVRRV
jgi:hypothetical protein